MIKCHSLNQFNLKSRLLYDNTQRLHIIINQLPLIINYKEEKIDGEKAKLYDPQKLYFIFIGETNIF